MDPQKREQLYKQMQDRMESSGTFVWLTAFIQEGLVRARKLVNPTPS
jgi:hypothetical protein